MYILKKLPAPKLNSPLLRYAKNRYSQSGEDGILEEIFKRLDIKSGKFCEFGAWDGVKLSNCAYFARDFGWEGVFIEGNIQRFKGLVENYSSNATIKCINSMVGFGAEDNLGTILKKVLHTNELDLDLVSIDIDGNDFHVMSAMDFSPKVIIVEINPSIPNDVYFVQDANPTINQGASLLAFLTLGRKLGYEPACCTSANLVLVREDLFSKLTIPKFKSISDLYSPKCDGRIFHGFDGKIYTVGMPRLIWHSNSPIGPEDLQALTPENRRLTLYD